MYYPTHHAILNYTDFLATRSDPFQDRANICGEDRTSAISWFGISRQSFHRRHVLIP